MALRNAENRIMAPKSNIIVGNVEEHFIFLHCRKRTKKMYILIQGGMLGWKYNFMINSMQFYSINAKKAKAYDVHSSQLIVKKR